MAPLTGFFGTNSSGKTAILQFLLMLKQTVESSDRNRILHLGGDQYSYADLGTNYDISHRHQLPKKIQGSLSWKPKLISQNILEIFPSEDEDEEMFTSTFSNYTYIRPLRFDFAANTDIDQISLEFLKYYFEGYNNQWNYVGLEKIKNNGMDYIYQLVVEGNFIKSWGKSGLIRIAQVNTLKVNLSPSKTMDFNLLQVQC